MVSVDQCKAHLLQTIQVLLHTIVHPQVYIDLIHNSNSNSNLFSLHTLAWAYILQFYLSIMVVFLISQPCFCIFNQISITVYLSYVSSTH